MAELALPLRGLDDAPSQWRSKISGRLTDGVANNCKARVRPELDPSLFFHRDESDKSCGALAVHVDDALVSGQGPSFDAAAQGLKYKFPFRK